MGMITGRTWPDQACFLVVECVGCDQTWAGRGGGVLSFFGLRGSVVGHLACLILHRPNPSPPGGTWCLNLQYHVFKPIKSLKRDRGHGGCALYFPAVVGCVLGPAQLSSSSCPSPWPGRPVPCPGRAAQQPGPMQVQRSMAGRPGGKRREAAERDGRNGGTGGGGGGECRLSQRGTRVVQRCIVQWVAGRWFEEGSVGGCGYGRGCGCERTHHV